MATTSSSTLPHGEIVLPLPAGGWQRGLMNVARPGIEWAIQLRKLNVIHSDAVARLPESRPADAVLQAMRVTIKAGEGDFENIPATGPVIVVANHPFGGVEGMALASIIERVRPNDTRLMANRLLGMVPALDGLLFLVDPFGGEGAVARNMSEMRKARKWVKDGGALGVFPAGEVSHATIRNPRIVDPAWSTTIARIARRTRATVVPVYFHGRNSIAFQAAGFVHPLLRTILLPKELLARQKQTLDIAIGTPISPERLERFDDDEATTDFIRARTYLLKGRFPTRRERRAARVAEVGPAPEITPVAEAGDPAAIAREIECLPDAQVLVKQSRFRVVHARGDAIPHTMNELGRLRELSFRGVGEGTGRARDLDEFDDYYEQLVVWDAEEARLVGAYRLGKVDEILREHGRHGLYTHTLFSYGRKLLDEIGPALELGRSFVREEYQRSYTPLMLLWKGIGGYVVRYPEYRMLFGPVSISNAYQSMSRQLLVSFLQATRFLEPLGRLIRPRHPLRDSMPSMERREVGAVATDLDDVETVVRDIETNRRSMPVLLRQYLKLNGKLLAFNVDPDFGDVVDGLMLVDLCDVDRRILKHYLGADGSAAFLAHHGRG